MKAFIKRNIIEIIGTLLGAVLGYIYWYGWGCTDGCPIRSNPYLMTLAGALLGYSGTGSILDLIKIIKKNENK